MPVHCRLVKTNTNGVHETLLNPLISLMDSNQARNPEPAIETKGEIKLPRFMPFNARLWFRMVNFIFARDGIRNEQIMYSTVKAHLCAMEIPPVDNDQWNRIEKLTVATPYTQLRVVLLAKSAKFKLPGAGPNKQDQKVNSATDKLEDCNNNQTECIKEIGKQADAQLDTELARELKNVSIG